MKPVVYLVQDLLFVARIREAASRLGLEVERAASPEALREAARRARLVIVDLRLPAALGALEMLAADPETARVPSVGFAGHQDVVAMGAASERGCRTVLPRGRFASDLLRLLADAPA